MMTNLFMLAGYTQYQAQCIAPFGYVVAAGKKSSSGKRKRQQPAPLNSARKLTAAR